MAQLTAEENLHEEIEHFLQKVAAKNYEGAILRTERVRVPSEEVYGFWRKKTRTVYVPGRRDIMLWLFADEHQNGTYSPEDWGLDYFVSLDGRLWKKDIDWGFQPFAPRGTEKTSQVATLLRQATDRL